MTNMQLLSRGALGLIFGTFFVISGCNAGSVESNPDMKPVSCKLEVNESFDQGAEVVVRFSLKNQSDMKFEVLQYHTPLEDLIGPVFEIRFEDEVLPYQGPMVKRRPPGDEDWLPMKPTASLTNELDISLAWELNRKGRYSISLSQDISYRVSGSTEVLSMPADNCPAVSFQVK